MRFIKGFTLTDLMATVSAAGIISAMAIPQYHLHSSRNGWSKAVEVTATIRLRISDCVIRNNGLLSKCDTPEKLGMTGLPHSDDATYQLLRDSASIEIEGRGLLYPCKQSLRPIYNGAELTWSLSNFGTLNGRQCSKLLIGSDA